VTQASSFKFIFYDCFFTAKLVAKLIEREMILTNLLAQSKVTASEQLIGVLIFLYCKRVSRENPINY
jgi:hypothetical protein